MEVLMKKGRLKRGLALLLSTATLSMSVIPHLPPDILTAYAFHMNFNTSTSGDGHYDISGNMPNQPITDFLCMKREPVPNLSMTIIKLIMMSVIRRVPSNINVCFGRIC